jgi:uncharacterized Ntn-hydrolase superfamily protein
VEHAGPLHVGDVAAVPAEQLWILVPQQVAPDPGNWFDLRSLAPESTTGVEAVSNVVDTAVVPPSTYSIAGCDLACGEWGVAVQSKFLAVGALVCWAEPGVGAIATQAWMNPDYGPDGLALLRQGMDAAAVVDALVSADAGQAQRQLGLVDGEGASSSFTGSECLDWAGSRTGDQYATQGNILVSEATVAAMETTFLSTGGSLAERLLAALVSGQAAGGDRRGQQAAALLVVGRGRGYGGCDIAVDLRVDDHPEPVAELERLLGLHTLYFGETPADEWLPVDGPLEAEIAAALASRGYASGDLGADLEHWAGFANLEERVSGAARIDPVVLGELRAGVRA